VGEGPISGRVRASGYPSCYPIALYALLLAVWVVSRWHKVDAAELWHCHGGAALLVEIKHGETRHEYRLGPDWHKGAHPHVAVLAHAWQSARSLGAWTLVGCTVAPGFDFSGLELAPDDWTP
jgi:predicted cupin superfamily sugar epimerase